MAVQKNPARIKRFAFLQLFVENSSTMSEWTDHSVSDTLRDVPLQICVLYLNLGTQVSIFQSKWTRSWSHQNTEWIMAMRVIEIAVCTTPFRGQHLILEIFQFLSTVEWLFVSNTETSFGTFVNKPLVLTARYECYQKRYCLANMHKFISLRLRLLRTDQGY